MTKNAAKGIFGSSLLLATVVAFVFSWDQMGLQFALSALLAVASIISASALTQKKISNYVWSILLLIVAVGLFMPLREAPFLVFLNFSFVLVALAVAVRELVTPGRLRLFDYPIAFLEYPVNSVGAISGLVSKLELRLNRKLSDTQSQVARGVLIAAPLLLLFGILFAAADAVFADIFRNVFDIELSLSGSVVARLIGFGVVFVLSAGGLTHTFLEHFARPDTTKTKKASNHSIELMIVLGSLNALFLLFIAIQAVYLFGGQEVVLDGDLTYAEYGRRGFFELVAVSGLVFALAFFVRRFLVNSQSKLPTYLMLALVAQVGVIMFSAIERLSLYEDVFGFTLLRFYSHSFIFFLMGAFGLLVYWLIARKSETSLLQALFLSTGVYLLALNLVSPDRFIANQNLARHEQTGKIDGSYFNALSVDAVDQKIEFYQRQGDMGAFDEPYLGNPRVILCDDLTRMGLSDSWSTYNFTRATARSKIADLNLNCDDVP